jgi:hypothetical protein
MIDNRPQQRDARIMFIAERDAMLFESLADGISGGCARRYLGTILFRLP